MSTRGHVKTASDSLLFWNQCSILYSMWTLESTLCWIQLRRDVVPCVHKYVSKTQCGLTIILYITGLIKMGWGRKCLFLLSLNFDLPHVMFSSFLLNCFFVWNYLKFADLWVNFKAKIRTEWSKILLSYERKKSLVALRKATTNVFDAYARIKTV